MRGTKQFNSTSNFAAFFFFFCSAVHLTLSLLLLSTCFQLVLPTSYYIPVFIFSSTKNEASCYSKYSAKYRDPSASAILPYLSTILLTTTLLLHQIGRKSLVLHCSFCFRSPHPLSDRCSLLHKQRGTGGLNRRSWRWQSVSIHLKFHAKHTELYYKLNQTSYCPILPL